MTIAPTTNNSGVVPPWLVRPEPRNPGIVPPWLQQPIRILPIEEPITILPVDEPEPHVLPVGGDTEFVPAASSTSPRSLADALRGR